jgi:hypothetical protein
LGNNKKILNDFAVRLCCKCVKKILLFNETTNGNHAIMCVKDDTKFPSADLNSRKGLGPTSKD